MELIYLVVAFLAGVGAATVEDWIRHWWRERRAYRHVDALAREKARETR